LPVEAPTRELLIGSLAIVAGAVQLVGWALARLPTFFVAFGLLLVATGLGFALAALIRQRRYRWVAHVGPETLMIVAGQRRTMLPWDSVRGVRYAAFRIRVTGSNGRNLVTLPVDRTRPAHEAAQVLERAIAAHLGTGADPASGPQRQQHGQRS
jgi:hypothetical protein